MKMLNSKYYFLLMLLLCLAGPGCGLLLRDHQQPAKSRTRQVKGPHGNIPIEVRQPPQYTIQATTPQRDASMQIVAHGKELLQSGQIEPALSLFQEAATLDGSNGITYYYIAKCQYLLHHFDQSLGILERAEALLVNMPDWQRSIAALREAITLAKSAAGTT